MDRVIGVGEYIISDNPDDVLKIYGLASCIGMVMYCPVKKVLGVAHFLLPSSHINPDLGKISPPYFVDTGVDSLVKGIVGEYRCRKENIVVSIYGGAKARLENDVFHIGNRNIEAVKKKLQEHQLKMKHSDVGGNVSRTIEIKVDGGKVTLKVQASHLT